MHGDEGEGERWLSGLEKYVLLVHHSVFHKVSPTCTLQSLLQRWDFDPLNPK